MIMQPFHPLPSESQTNLRRNNAQFFEGFHLPIGVLALIHVSHDRNENIHATFIGIADARSPEKNAYDVDMGPCSS